MPRKDMGLKKRNIVAPMSKEYRKGGKLYMHGGRTEVGKEAKPYKEYVKEIFGGGMTSEPAMKREKYDDGGFLQRARRKLLPTSSERIEDWEIRQTKEIERRESRQERLIREAEDRAASKEETETELLERRRATQEKELERRRGIVEGRKEDRAQAEAAQERVRKARERALEKANRRRDERRGN
jgi:hypothetical protein